MREVTRYALTAQGRVAMLPDGARLRIQQVLCNSDALPCRHLALLAKVKPATVRRHVSGMLRDQLLRRVV